MSEPGSVSGRDPEEGRGPGQPADTTISLGALSTPDAVEAETGLTAADTAAIDALPVQSALLVVQRGPNAGARFLLDAERTTAGRRPDSDIFLDDVTVSRKHAEFRRVEGGFEVVDAGSLNGTYVNQDRVDAVRLRNGSEVRIGKFRLTFYAGVRQADAPQQG